MVVVAVVVVVVAYLQGWERQVRIGKEIREIELHKTKIRQQFVGILSPEIMFFFCLAKVQKKSHIFPG